MKGNGGDTGIEDVLRQALDLGEEGQWEEMATLLSETLDSAEDDPVLLCWLGVAESELGNDGAAYEAFRRCLDQDPTDANVLALAGAGLAAFDDPDAETALRAAALSAPDLLMARLNYGAYLSRAGLFDEAIEHLRAGKELAPDDPIVRAELGAAHVLKGDRDPGLAELEEAIALAPDDSWTRVLYGLVLTEAERFEEGAEELVRAARERDDDAEAIALGALAAAIAGWEDAAEELLAKAEYAVEGADVKMLDEVESAIRGGPDAARRLLRGALGPSTLRERLAQPL
jgi:tetratricopeptide (TPR) repeat protein